jgi:hypothetical protein
MVYFLLTLLVGLGAVFLAQQADIEGLNTRPAAAKPVRSVARRPAKQARGVSLAQFVQQ